MTNDVDHSPRLWSRHALAVEFELPRQRVTAALGQIPPDGYLQGRHPAWYLVTAIPALFNVQRRQLWTRAALAREFELPSKRVRDLLANVPPDGQAQAGRVPAWYLTSAIPVLIHDLQQGDH